MKKLIFIFLSAVLGVYAANAQTGTWNGSLDVQGTKLPIVFHLDDDNPTIDSPAQGAKGIPVTVKRIAPDSISVKIPLIRGAFAGKYDGNRITGTFSQSGFSLPLVLSPGENALRRPQTPQPPFPYGQEEVTFSNGDAVLKGTLTLPEGYDRNTPVLIMVTGSGLQNRDEEIFGHKPFAVIADALARNGVATLRYDDRGFGESTGDAVNCTTEDLMKDALSGIELLRGRFDRVGVLGHSEGGSIALMLAADGKVDFAVSLAGMVVSGKETLLDQNRYLLSHAGYPHEVVDEYCDILTLIFDNDESATQRIETTALPAPLKTNLKAVVAQVKTPYLQYTLASDLRGRLGSVSCPVLALNGTKDTQVFANKNLEALRSGLPASSRNKILEMEGLNHMFQHCSTGAVTEYATNEETFSPEVLTIITDWLKGMELRKK